MSVRTGTVINEYICILEKKGLCSAGGEAEKGSRWKVGGRRGRNLHTMRILTCVKKMHIGRDMYYRPSKYICVRL